MIEAYAERIAVKIKNTNPDQTASVAVMKYSLTIMMTTLCAFILSVLVGIVTRELPLTLLALGSFALLRFVSGGYHFKSTFMCIVGTAAVLTPLPHIPVNSTVFYALTIISLLLLAIFAPTNIRGYAKLPEKYFPVLKLIALAIVSANFLIQSEVMALAFFIQAVTVSLCRR